VKLLALVLSAIALGPLTSALGSAQQTPQTQDQGPLKALRESCVSVERRQVAIDANDFSHLKDTDWASAMFCQGLIQGFEIGANNTVYVLSEPMRLEIVDPQPRVRQIAKAVVTFIDEHPDKTDPRTILLGALQKEGAAILVGPMRIQDLTPACPKDVKDIPATGCNLKSGPDAK
jgi:hypothetical protein